MKAAKPANMATPISQCGMSIFAPCPPRHTASTVVHDFGDGRAAEGKGDRHIQASPRGRGAGYLAFAKARQKPRSFVETERHLLRNWSPLLELRGDSVTRRQIAEGLALIEAEKGAVAARCARSAISSMFTWAMREGHAIAVNPVSGTNPPPEPPSRARVLSNEELRELWLALGTDQFSDIVRLLVLTAQRREEIGGLRWTEIDLAVATIALPAERTKNRRAHIIPLSSLAGEILARQPRQWPWVFGNARRSFTNWGDPKRGLPALRAPYRLHDLRRSAATGMAELGVLPHVIEALLNHVSGHRAGVAGIYNRATYAREMREALERWAEHVEGITK